MTASPTVVTTCAPTRWDFVCVLTWSPAGLRRLHFWWGDDAAAATKPQTLAEIENLYGADSVQSRIHRALEEYMDGAVGACDALPANLFDISGTEFQRDVWEAMREIPAGETVTYGELAAMAGRPRAIRAAANACPKNALALVIPCHRVVAANGIGGYFYDLSIKEALLSHELEHKK